MRLPNIKRMYEEIGEKIAGTLTCGTCGRVEDCPPAKASQYTAHGWPKCCGYTMTLSRPPAAGARP